MLVKSIEEIGDDRFFVVDAVLDKVLLGESFVTSGYDLIDETTSIFFLLLLLVDIVTSGFCQILEYFFFGPGQFL